MNSAYFQSSRTLITLCGLSGSGDQGCKPSIRIAVKKSHFLVEELVSVASADSLSNFRFGFRVSSVEALSWMTKLFSRDCPWHAKSAEVSTSLRVCALARTRTPSCKSRVVSTEYEYRHGRARISWNDTFYRANLHCSAQQFAYRMV